ncbi:glycosyltransferase family 25 protein [Rhizobium oryzicola]|uniref:Glycosyltransferase family 25 protein n=1 Tax=Rhizobium oryzicola TaxID=1232668 RepID=A0ABT8T052_9HYPH|nr:glycosyltransferase family 25 protein [Rhizobium oryzicola]MDO1584023.1 glycosyltransferase family 25 protein [Rhizobium oryzicola]
MAVSLPGSLKSAPGGRPLGVFAINLDRSPDRWASIERAFGDLPWPLHRVAAVDAKRDPQSVLAVRGQAIRHEPDAIGWNSHRNRLFMLTEEACLASHVLVWRQFLQSDFEHALVLEDDAVSQAGFVDCVTALLTEGLSADIVKLEGIARSGARKALAIRRLNAGHLLVRSLRPSSGSAAYLVSRKGAETLLCAAKDIRVPADDFLWTPAFHGLDIAHVSPWVIMQSGAVSVIGHDLKTKRARSKAPIARGLLMPMKRAMERLGLVWAALQGNPLNLLNVKMVPWAPNNYNPGEETALAAEDQRSSNG